MVVNISDTIMSIILLFFFGAQILDGNVRTICMVLASLFVIVFCLKRKKNIFVIIFLLLLVQPALQGITNGLVNQAITYLDEIVEIIFAVYLLYIAIHDLHLYAREKKIMVLYFCYILITAISSVMSWHSKISIIALDCFMCIKFMVFYRGGVELSKRKIFDGKDLYNYIDYACKALSVILLLLSIHDIIFSPFLKNVTLDILWIPYNFVLPIQLIWLLLVFHV